MTDIMEGPILAHRADQFRTEETLLEQWLYINEGMGTDNLDRLKFVCRDHIIESMTSLLEVFHQLQERLLIKPDNVDFLIECLGLIHRNDLLGKLGYDSTHIEKIIENFSGYTRISNFRKLLLDVAENLNDIELKEMKFLLSWKVGERRLQNHKTVLDLFVYMEQEHMLTHVKTEPLVKILKKIKRMDLVHKIQAYQVQTAQPLPQNAPGLYPNQNEVQILDLQNRLNAMTVEQREYFLMANQQNVQQPLRINSQPGQQTSAPNVHMQTGERVPVEPVVQSNVAPLQPNPVPRVYENPGPNSTPAVDNLPPLPEYPMSDIPRGWCVIINNRDFKVIQNDSESKELPRRTGTDVDAESLQRVFEKLRFRVRRRDNLSDTQMMQFLRDMAHNVNHTNFDCFVCCILTHGVLNHLYGTNGKLISIKKLTFMFQANQCPTLTGKPKLFFLQACQGRDKMSGGEQNIERDAGHMPPRKGNLESDADLQTDGKEMIPNEADFVIGYATVPGYVSFRSPTLGSWYISKLCKLLKEHSHRDDLMSILVHVNNEVSEAYASIDNGTYKQMPASFVTLRKKLYFR